MYWGVGDSDFSTLRETAGEAAGSEAWRKFQESLIRTEMVVYNEGQKPYQDAYFKESLKTFVRIPAGLALHYINYTRASDLGRIERWIGAGKIKDSQNATVEALQAWLSLKGPT